MPFFSVWYMRPDWFRNGICGAVPNPMDLQATHILLKEIEAADLAQVYAMMQGEIWSPNGEAQGFIRGKGLAHTSMSVGDVIESETGTWLVAAIGFTQLDAPAPASQPPSLIFDGNGGAFLPIRPIK